MDLLRQDVRFALRRLRRSPGFTAVAVLSLALGIGANSAIFSIVNAILLRRPPVERIDRLVEIYTNDDNGFQYAVSSIPDYKSLVEGTRGIFQDVIAYEIFIAQNSQGENSRMVMGELVSGSYFTGLGVRPVLGRGFLPEEDATPGTHPVLVLGYGYWQRELGGATNVLGQTVMLNRRAYTVVGVAPPQFKGAFPALDAQVYVPLAMVNTLMPGGVDRINLRGSRSLFMKGRLAEGVTVAQASAALRAVSQRLEREFPQSNDKRRMHLLPSTEVSLHPAVDKVLAPVAALLLAVVGGVLLIACANLASFLLARAADRRREITVRLALGAARWRVARLVLTESALLAVGGGLAGVGLAYLLVRALLSYQPPLPVPLDLAINVDARVLAFTALISILAGLAFGFVPALQSSKQKLAATLRDEANNVTGGRRRITLRNTLVAGQIAISLTLLIGSGLFVRSLQKAQAIDPGFYTGPAVIVLPNIELSGYDETRGRQLQQQMAERLRALPGVTHVTLANRLPLGSGVQTRGMNIAGVQPPPGLDKLDIDFVQVDENYFNTLEIPIIAGRSFGASDNERSAPAVIVSQAAAQRYWPGRSAIGQTIRVVGRGDQQVQVIGVARDTRVRTLGEEPRPYVYFNGRQEYMAAPHVVVRGNVPAVQLLTQVRRAVLELDPQLVLMEAKTMDQHLSLMLYPPRMAALLLSVFGLLALLLSAIGLYGLVSYAVSKRTREVGIRMALGANAGQVIWLMTSGGLKLVATGTAIGMALAGALSWSLARFLYGVSSTDLITFVAIPALLGAVGLAACYLPARRAARAAPIAALGSE